jgi:hypothetical protein
VSTLNSGQSANGKNDRNGEGRSITKTSPRNIIAEDDAENQMDEEDRRREQVQNLVKQGKMHAGKTTIQKNGKPIGGLKGPNGNGGPTMKGIIGRTKGAIVNKEAQQNVWSKLAFEYDLDKIIPKEEQNKPPSHRQANKAESELSVGSKFQNYEINSDYSYRARNSAPGSARKA